MLSFIYAPSAHDAAKYLSERLMNELGNGQPVLWFVTGGSNIAIDAEVMKTIPETMQSNLMIMLTDERYGEYGHPDSNWRQLREAGFSPGNATATAVLNADNPSLESTRQRYHDNLQNAFERAASVIGFFGIGDDGHIAGMLPHSPALESDGLTAAYQSEQFTRITMAPNAFSHLTAAYAFVFGAAKKPALDKLQHENLPREEEPSQILKQLPESYVYTDQISQGESADSPPS
jgi:6-phosphogluconolactonase/glucosamine-6-phosphate isomerase/deaminase